MANFFASSPTIATGCTKTFDSVPALRKAVLLGYSPIRPWMSVVYRWLYDFNSCEYFYDGSSYGTQHTLQNF
uniref:Omega-6 fatty acid desaturase, chloroplastic n=1 Tax=Solanum tuberosum TaxID=4113 RepID=M1BLV6_SOLTU